MADLTSAVTDGAIREERGEALVNGSQEGGFAPDIQECFCRTSERSLGQVFSTGRGTNSQFGFIAQSFHELTIRIDHVRAQIEG